MAKMYFDKTVKYKGIKHLPHTTFEVADEEVEDLKKSGGWVVEETKVVEKEIVAPTITTAIEQTPPTLEELKKKATSLGINVKGSWGIKKLTEEISKFED